MSYQLCKKAAELLPYEPISGEYAVRLDANESFVTLSEDTLDEITDGIRKAAFNRYPDPRAEKICRLFAAYYGVDSGIVTAGNGSDELLSIVTQSLLMRGDTMAVLKPDFSMYGIYGELAEANVVTLEKGADDEIDPQTVIDGVSSCGARLLIFSNPCNPTGLGLEREKVLRIVDGCPDCLVVVDEAYMDFWDQSVIKETAKRDNMMVLRTCSKAIRMAGARCGFAVSNAVINKAMQAVKSPYNVNTLSQIACGVILSRPEELRDAVKQVLCERDKLYNALYGMAMSYPDVFSLSETKANFVFLRIKNGKAAEIFELLKADGIVVRLMGDKLRVTAGTGVENVKFIMSFEDIIRAQ